MSEIGSGSGSSYPASLDTDSSLEINSPNPTKTKARAEVVNDLAAAIIAIQTELGTDPAGLLTDVKTYLQTEHNPNGTHATSDIAIPPAGVIVAYGGSAAPTSWLLCDGSAVNRTTYSALFAVVGTSFGSGDGSTTFNVPDLRGRFPLGKDNMGGSSANRVTASQADNLGQGSGAETHTLAVSEMPSHDHGLHSGWNLSGNLGPDTTKGLVDKTEAQAQAGGIANTGGGGSHNNMSPYQTVNYIIKT